MVWVPIQDILSKNAINNYIYEAYFSLTDVPCFNDNLETSFKSVIGNPRCFVVKVKQIWSMSFMHWLYFCHFINTTAYHLGRYKPSSLSNRELHWLPLSVHSKQRTLTYFTRVNGLLFFQLNHSLPLFRLFSVLQLISSI